VAERLLGHESPNIFCEMGLTGKTERIKPAYIQWCTFVGGAGYKICLYIGYYLTQLKCFFCSFNVVFENLRVYDILK